MTYTGWSHDHYYRVVRCRVGYRWFLYRCLPHPQTHEPTIGPLLRHGWTWTAHKGFARAIDAIRHPRQRRHHEGPVDLHHRRRPR